MAIGKIWVFLNFIEQQKFHKFFSYEITHFPQESVSVSAEESTTSPTKEASSDVPTAETTESRNAVVPVEETKIAEDVTEPPTPVATKDSEEPTNSSDAMETDAPAPEQESSNNAAA